VSYNANPIYVANGTRTASTVLNGFVATVKTAPWYSAATNLFSVTAMGAGSCDGLSYTTPNLYGRTMTFDVGAVLCGSYAASLYTLLSVGLMLAASWVAWRIAFL
jgi:hypothetical protein